MTEYYYHMPYTQFKTLKQVKNDFDLTIIENRNFIPKLEPTSPSSVLSASLERTLPSVIASSSEKVRSEGIVYPVLIEVRELLDRVVNVFSGEDFTGICATRKPLPLGMGVSRVRF